MQDQDEGEQNNPLVSDDNASLIDLGDSEDEDDEIDYDQDLVGSDEDAGNNTGDMDNTEVYRILHSIKHNYLEIIWLWKYRIV